MFKFPKENNGLQSGERWSEKLASDIMHFLGIPCMDVEIARYRRKEGSLCSDLVAQYGNFFEVYDGLPTYEHIPDYHYVFSDLRNTFLPSTFEQIVVMMMLDYIIGNNDRHAQNFAILQRDKSLCPLYDNGSSLANLISEENIHLMAKNNDMYEAFVFRRPRSKCHLVDEPKDKPLTHLVLMGYLKDNETHLFLKSLNIFRQLDDKSLAGILDKFENYLSVVHRAFIRSMIHDRLLKIS